jgi:prepilin-type N-terminal cleavage/methylation domain-containing protein
MRHAPKPSRQRKQLPRTNRPRDDRWPAAGFTLIEMLVVVVIIAILASMVLGLFKIGTIWQAKSVTNEKLGRVRAAIEEFNAEYGKYPPVNDLGEYGGQPFGYEYAASNLMSVTVLTTYFPAGTNVSWHQGPVFTFGLMSFLVNRFAGHGSLVNVPNPEYWNLLAMAQWEGYNLSHGDQGRDLNAINRWSPHLEGVADVTTIGRSISLAGTVVAPGYYTNYYLSVHDGWGKELNYKSDKPYNSYRLWSNGPDGISGTADDVATGAGF